MVQLKMKGAWSPLPRATVRLAKPHQPHHGPVYRVRIPTEALPADQPELELRIDGQAPVRQVEAETSFIDDRQVARCFYVELPIPTM